MKRLIFFLGLLLWSICGTAQKTLVSGTVTDAKTGEGISQASVTADGGKVTVVTNEDGFFTLKSDDMTETITVSHIGYQSKNIKMTKSPSTPVRISLVASAIPLQEVFVWKEDPLDLMRTAIRKIPDNYSGTPELYSCFYRETAMKRGHYISVAEGVVNMYKTAYSKSTARDRVAIVKGRRLLSPKASDTLGVKVMGGPTQPVQLDMVKNTDFLFNEQELANYTLGLEPSAVINDRLQYVISLTPHVSQDYALFFGKVYIDRETLAFTRVELSLDVSDRQKATNFMLIRKPSGVRFKPKELSCLVEYQYNDERSAISYIRNTFRFNCDWKRRLYGTPFTASCEMVVTDRHPVDGRPISGRESFDSRDAFFDHVDYFLDPDFWEDYNIIEPSVTLDKAIGWLLKKHRRNK